MVDQDDRAERLAWNRYSTGERLAWNRYSTGERHRLLENARPELTQRTKDNTVLEDWDDLPKVTQEALKSTNWALVRDPPDAESSLEDGVKGKYVYVAELIVAGVADIEKHDGTGGVLATLSGYRITKDGLKINPRPKLTLAFDDMQAVLDADLMPSQRVQLTLVKSQGKLKVEDD